MNQISSFLSIFSRSLVAREVSFAPDETIFGQGEPGDSVFVVKAGKVGIFREKSVGREMIAMRGPGHLVGEMALFGQKRRSASLVALSACNLLRVEAEEVLRLLASEPALGLAISRLLAIRLQELMDQNLEEKNHDLEMSRLALESAYRELASVLDRSPHGVLCLGSAGQFRWSSARAAELLGLASGAELAHESLPPGLRRLLAPGPRAGERILVDGRSVLAEAEPLPGGGRVVFLTAKDEVGRMARALADLGATFTLEDLAGSSPQIAAVKDFVLEAARTASSVLVQGEPGTGKELIAQAIHNASDRWQGPFVRIHCTDLPAELLDRELFGAVKGAPTGPAARAPGKLEQAQGGTLFLDEIGALPLEPQARLLRVLRQAKIHRPGHGDLPLDVRLVAATNRDLDAEAAAGAFRGDLLERIRGLHIKLPPLRQRLGDIPALARAFLERSSARHGKRLRRLSSRVLSALSYHSWPDNVRELANVLERAVSLAEPHEEVLRQVELPAPGPPAKVALSPVVPLKRLEEQALRQALRSTAGNVDQAATALGISRAALLRKLKAHGVDRENP